MLTWATTASISVRQSHLLHLQSPLFGYVPRSGGETVKETTWTNQHISPGCEGKEELRSVKACPEISAIRNVWAAASRAIVQWKNGVCLSEVSDGSSGSSGELAFPPPVWTRGAKLVYMRKAANAAVFYLSFLLFSVFVVDVSCFQLWEMLGQVKNIDVGVCKLLTQVVHITLDTLLAKARSFVDNCTFWDRIRQRECRCALADRVASEPTRLGLCVHGQLLSCLQQLSTRHACSRDQAPAPRAHSRLNCDSYSDLTGSVDHTHCCTLHMRRPSHLYGRGAFEPVEERPVGERQWAWTVGKTRKTPLLSIKTQQRADTTRSRRDNTFSSHACGNTKPGWTSSFSPSSWRGQRHARRRPNLFQWRTREKVLGGTKSWCVLSAVQRQISSCEFRIKRCTVLCFRMWLQRLVV